MQDITDEELLRRVALEDEEAVGILYERHGRLAYSLAYRVIGDAAAAEDIVQEAFLKVWRKAPSFDASRGNARTWLLSIVHHQAIDASRSSKGLPPAHFLDEAESIPSEGQDVWREVAARIDREVMIKALSTLPKEQREAIALGFYGGYTHKEIADRTGVPLGTVKGRIRIGMDKLRELLIDQQVGYK